MFQEDIQKDMEGFVQDTYQQLVEDLWKEEDILSDHEDTISETTTHEYYLSLLSEDQWLQLEEDIFYLIETYLQENPCIIAYDTYEKIILANTSMEAYHVVLSLFEELTTMDETLLFCQVEEFVKERIHIYIHSILEIPRSISLSEEHKYLSLPVTIDTKQQQILYLTTIPQPKQRTPEWYEFRYNKMTATHIGKLLSIHSEANYNRIIYEKCKPLKIEDDWKVNISSPMHWGVKYEPVTLAIYEQRFHTKVGEFGCIPHPQYTCIGASPDGINIDITNLTRYGRMIEIKNVVSRKITGIPITSYWIQTQIQMEVCNLEECDFVETKFQEFQEFDHIYTNHMEKQKGVILSFTKPDVHIPLYVYMPVTIPIEPESITTWISQEIMKQTMKGYLLYTQIAWYLDEFSCVLIRRNRSWFQAVVPKILDTWEIILKERESGYEHRMAKKKSHGPLVVFQLDA